MRHSHFLIRSSIALAVLLLLTQAASAQALNIRIYPASSQPDALQTMRSFASDLDRQIRSIDVPADTETSILNSTAVQPSAFITLADRARMTQIIQLTPNTIGVIQQRSYDPIALRSDFAFTMRPGRTPPPNLTTDFVQLVGSGTASKTGSALQLHKVVVLYIAAREAFAAQHYAEAQFYVSTALSLLRRAPSPQLVGIAKDLNTLRDNIRARFSEGSR